MDGFPPHEMLGSCQMTKGITPINAKGLMAFIAAI
jgi:hypothetical protein